MPTIGNLLSSASSDELLGDAAAEGDAGIVEHHVDAPERRLHAICVNLERSTICHVQHRGLDGRPMRGTAHGRRLLEMHFVDVGQGKAGPAFGQLEGKGPTDP